MLEQQQTKQAAKGTAKQALVKKRSGELATFEPELIFKAIEKAFRADMDIPDGEPSSDELRRKVQEIANDVVNQIADPAYNAEGVDVEYIQDVVEQRLMHYEHYSVARRYIVYREEHARARKLRGVDEQKLSEMLVVRQDGSETALQWDDVRDEVIRACDGLEDCSAEEIVREVSRTLYNQMDEREVSKACVLAARSRIEKDPAYSVVSARLLLNTIYGEVFGSGVVLENAESAYRENFENYLEGGIEAELITKDILVYDLKKLAAALQPERDQLFQYMGLQTIYDRYLLHQDKRRIEAPQYFWMRVSMGLASAEGDQKEDRAIEFYNTLSTFRFVSSTPTLFNSATLHPQLSSCYLSTISDDLSHIFKVVADNAALSKWAGGIGNDWTSVRATGALIKGTNGESQGVVPFLKVANDTAIAVNQGGKRKGAVCAYLESWHLELEEFLELRKNTGDERRRTHDMHTANWVPDLFLKRVRENADWTLFSPSEVPELHDIYGKEFEKRYVEYEALAAEGKLKQHKKLPAQKIWRKMLSMLFETGHPWITFKDPSNIRSPQDHVGVVHNSNLCTEILLNTSEEETAVCNLGSINLAAHTTKDGLDEEMIKETITTAVRMLDNVIDINFYPTIEARNSNLRHRPIGLGMMGFQDALYIQRTPYTSDAAVEFADASQEMVSYYALLASTKLAEEREPYQTFQGSKWDRGILPIDSIELLEHERGGYCEIDKTKRMDWDVVRRAIKQNGMRNSNVMAIAPTATIANISGVSQSIEPTYRHLYVKSNLSGEFIVVNPYLVHDLKDLGMWDDEMIDDLKYYDGLLENIDRIPAELKELYRTAFAIDHKWLIECASRRQKWIDMGQSLNLYIAEPNGKMLNDMYMLAWEKGLKTTYYLRSLAATQIEKSSIDVNKRGVQPKWMKSQSASSGVEVERESSAPKACSIEDPDCDACQ